MKKTENSLFCTYDPLGVKLLSRLRLQFSHLNGYRFRDEFGDTISPVCARRIEGETTGNFILC